MKLIIQIPCYNEEEALPITLDALPEEIAGIDQIEVLVIDDGSTDRTREVAEAFGVEHIVTIKRNMGLAHAFKSGLDTCRELGADVVVNLDADNQYDCRDIARLIEPILSGAADMVVGDRCTSTIAHFSVLKKVLQRFGSVVVSWVSGSRVNDATSGFRAFGPDAMVKLTVLSKYTYTLETILQARTKGLRIENVSVATNPPLRPSRLVKSVPSYVLRSANTIVRIATLYEPFRFFSLCSALFIAAGVLIGMRFLGFYFAGEGGGHVQSLILVAILLLIGVMLFVAGVIADLIQFNRRVLDEIVSDVRLGHYRDRQSHVQQSVEERRAILLRSNRRDEKSVR